MLNSSLLLLVLTIPWLCAVNGAVKHLSLLSKEFIKNQVIHTNSDSISSSNDYRLDSTSGHCPGDIFTINSTTGAVSLLQTVHFTYNSVQCHASVDPLVYQPVLESYHCFIMQAASDSSQLLIIDVIPDSDLIDWEFTQPVFKARTIGGSADSLVYTDAHLHATSTNISQSSVLLNYTLENEPTGLFTVQQDTVQCTSFAKIRSISALDELFYNLTVQAASSSQYSVTSTTSVSIVTTHTNSHAPSLINSPSSLTLPSNTPRMSVIATLESTDEDSGPAGTVRYLATSGGDRVGVNPVTGDLVWLGGIDDVCFNFTVLLHDLGLPQKSTESTITIFIATFEEFNPSISIAGGSSVGESTPVGTTVSNIVVQDSANAMNISTNLMCDSCSGCFQLMSACLNVSSPLMEYDVVLVQLLNYEVMPSHDCTVSVTNGNSVIEEKVTFVVVDDNDPPYFSQSDYSISVTESVPVGTSVLLITATDEDASDSLMYTIENANNLFEIDPHTGLIHTISQLSTDVIVMNISVSDGIVKAFAIATVTITPVDNASPMFSSPIFMASVYENVSTAESIFSFVATDANQGCPGAVEYSIVQAEPPHFTIDSISGLLYVKAYGLLDYEQLSSAIITIQATSLGEYEDKFSSTTLNLNILNSNDNTPIIDPVGCPCFIEEETDKTQYCQELHATDEDGDFVSYMFDNGSSYNELFFINPSTGVVSTSTRLDHEQQHAYELYIVATDTERISEPVKLVIQVLDINDSPPLYVTSSISIDLPQDTPIGTSVGDAGSSQGDAGYNAITDHSFSTDTPQSVRNTFNLDPLSGELTLAKAVTKNTVYSFDVLAVDTLNSSQQATVSVEVQVNGDANIPPYFSSSNDQVLVPSNLPTGSTVATVTATDNDVIEYSMNSNTFSIESDTGSITLEQPPLEDTYTLNITASDGSLDAFLTLIISVYQSTTIIDGVEYTHNSGVGVCSYTGHVTEGTVVQGDHVVTMATTQGGQSISYSIVDDEKAHLFTVSGNSITTVANEGERFDRTVNEALYLMVRATYGGSLFHLCSVTAIINDINDHAPLFTSGTYSVEVYQTTPTGSSVFQFQAFDPDSEINATTTYKLLTTSLPFSVDSKTGHTRLTSSLSVGQYTLTVLAADSQNPLLNDTALLVITVLATTNSPPAFSDIVSSLSVPEDKPLGSTLTTILGSDSDGGSQGSLTYCLLSSTSYFSVSNDGKVVVEQTLDYDSLSSPWQHNVSVMVYDDSPNPMTAQASFTVALEDVNDETPTFLTDTFASSVTEGAGEGLSVLTVKAYDRDSGSNGDILYALTPSSDWFGIDSITGVIDTSANVIDRETLDSEVISLTVMAIDQGISGLSSTAAVHITVLDKNDYRPKFVKPAPGDTLLLDIPQSTPVNSTVYTVSATDQDYGLNAEIHYTITANDLFYIDTISGDIVLYRSIEYETYPLLLELTVTATDLGETPLGSSTTVTFSITDTNDNYPLFSHNVYTCRYSEDSASTLTIDSVTFPGEACKVNATDSDIVNNTISYYITGDNSLFAINNGVISVSDGGGIDYDSVGYYIITVVAADSGVPSLSATAQVIVNILDVNDEAPEFDSTSTVWVPDSLPTGTILFRAHATDPDTADEGALQYSLLSEASSFNINQQTGDILLDSELYYTRTHYDIEVLVSDSEGVGVINTYPLRVLPVNNNPLPPQFSYINPLLVEVVSSSPPGTIVTVLTATDEDDHVDNYIEYFMIGKNYFSINRTSGEVFVSEPLTSLAGATLSVQALAIDSGFPPLHSIYNLTIIVSADPVSVPVFTTCEYSMSVSESKSNKNYIVGHVLALINDRYNSQVVYRMTDISGEVPFSVNSSTGAVYVSGTLDREFMADYFFTVESYHLLSNTSRSLSLVHVAIQDENDFSPNFPTSLLDIIIPSSYTTGDNVVRLFVTDKDEGINAVSTFALTPSYGFFTINSSTGVVSLLATPTSGVYNFTVTASNQVLADRHFDTTITVTDQLVQSTINCPNLFVVVPEDTPTGNVVYTVSVMGSGLLFYRLDTDDTLAIHPSTGEVFLTTPIDREVQDTYNVSVIVWDGVSDDVTSCPLSLGVEDVNDNRPVFSNLSYQFGVVENSPEGTVIGIVEALDPDIVKSQVTYDIELPQYSGMFSVHPTNGCLTVNGSIDREELPNELVITVSARDEGDKLSYATVTIEILDENDNGPILPQLLPNVTIMENINEGTYVLAVTALDTDLMSVTNYTVTVAAGGDGKELTPFVIDNSTGVISTAGLIDYETASYYELVITATDVQNPLFNDITVLYVLVHNLIDTSPNLPNITDPIPISENLEPHSFVVSVSPGMDGVPHPITYTLLNGTDHFYIEAFSGVLRTLVPLDYEEEASHWLAIRGSFDDQFYSQLTVIVEVIDKNDHSPQTTFTNLTFVVSESAMVGMETIFDLGYVDGDSGSNGDVQYVHILDPPFYNDTFHIDTTGQVTLKQPLDRETKSFYHFEVFVSDGGTPQLYLVHSLSIVVSDVNDNTPLFEREEYSFTISGPVIVGEDLFQVSATDADENSEITYQLVDSTETFEVNTETGVFTIHNNIHLRDQYSLQLLAADEGGLNTSAYVTVEVRYCRFSNLSFQPFSHTAAVAEDTPTGTRILSTKVNDFGVPGMLYYYITTVSEYFSVDSATGELYLDKSLDFESNQFMNLLLQVKDINSTELRIAEAAILISVMDVNDNHPTFADTPYAVFVRDDTKQASVIFTVSAIDKDANSTVTYTISSSIGLEKSVFDINETTGDVVLLSLSNSASHGDKIELVITASDNGAPFILSSNETLVVTIVDSNAPSFTQPVYVATVPETTTPTTIVLSVQASPSNISSAQLFYSIVDTQLDDAKFPFSIDPYNGNVSVNDRGLDREVIDYYRFSVKAEDGELSLSTEVEVQIYIEDINDESPQFSQPLYTFTIDENSLGNTVVGNVSATDSDTPPFAQITYFISSSSAVPFTIDPSSGILRSSMELDYESQSFYQFSVFANDSGHTPLQGMATVRVIVNNINDNPPVIHPPTDQPMVPEYPPLGYLVAIVSASDPDDDDISYVAIKGSENFVISDDGLIRVRDNVTIFPDPLYHVVIQATDGVHTANATIDVSVVDENDNSPVFSQEMYLANITENSPPGVYIVMVTATDADRGSNAEIHYSGNLEEFNINSSTGVITTSNTIIDREKNEVYNLVVIARDGGDRTDTSIVRILVRDVNDHPPHFTQASYIVYLNEESPDDTPVLTVTAIDPDEGANGTVTYEIMESNVTVPFYINSDSGLIAVLGDINFEVQPVWNFFVLATDGGGLTSNPANVTVNLNNIADANPQFSKDVYMLNVPEDSFKDPLLTPNVTFPDDCFAKEFSVFDGSSLPFSIHMTSGTITADGTLNRVENDYYTFTILIQCVFINNGQTENRFDTALVQVTVTDVNEPPSVAQLLVSEEISESTPINTTVTVITGIDTDLGDNGTLRYSIVSEGVPFDVDDVTGVLMTTELLDRERNNLYVLQIQISDLGTPPLSTSAFVSVTIADENDSPPEFECESGDNMICVFDVSIAEGTPTDTPLFTLAVDDPDQVGDISFQLTSTAFSISPELDNNNMVIGGVVSTMQELDRETRDWYQFEVVVNDGIHTASALVLINITDINDETPLFTADSYQITIPENYPPRVAVVTINAVDKDIGVNAVVTYSLLNSLQLNNITINGSTGEIHFLQSPDYEVSTRIDLLAQASDTGGLTDTVAIVINILDVNDNAPVFSEKNYTYSVMENALYGSDIGYVLATDIDSGDNGLVSYYLDSVSEYFHINPIDGLITTKQHLDRELNDSVQITIVARDSGSNVTMSSFVGVLVNVLDVNDNAPMFEGVNDGFIASSASELASVNSLVLSVNASDPDVGSNADLSFFLTGDNSDDFSLQSAGNEISITVAKKLNHESIPSYDLTLAVVDNGLPSKRTEVSLVIQVSDENDNKPVFVRQYEATIAESTAPGIVVVQVEANDLDSLDSQLVYSIIDEQDSFVVNSTNGDIIVNRQLDYETTVHYELTVVASEQRPNPQTAQTQVTINIEDVNDNPPVFICGEAPCPTRQIAVTENGSPGEVVGNFSVTDADTVTNINDITFAIASGEVDDNNGLTVFSIDSLSGQLRSLTSLDREYKDEYHLIVTASDNGSPPLTSSSRVTISVSDVNDNIPLGEEQLMLVYLKDGETGSDSLGHVAFTDSDIINHHRFTLQTPPSANWIQLSDDGLIILQSSSVKPGSYPFEINIQDTLYNGSVVYTVTTATVEVRNVTMETVLNSITLAITNISLLHFISNHLVSFTQVVTIYLNQHIDGGMLVDDVLIFSITEYDITVSIELELAVKLSSDGNYLNKDLLLHYLFIGRREIEDSTGLSIVDGDVDHCAGEPCSDNGLCLAVPLHYLYQQAVNEHSNVVFLGMGTHPLVTCDCCNGKSGPTCSENRLSCDDVECGDKGQCVQEDTTGCECDHGYVGESCDIPLLSHDLCASQTCSNDGVCTSSHSGFTCTCQAGFTGTTCSQSTDPKFDGCHRNPCLHGGVCTWSDDTNSSYTCSCPNGYLGDHCQVFVFEELDQCPSDKCEGCIYSPYHAHCVTTPITCTDLSCPGNATCVEVGSTAICEDTCSPNPCSNGGECIPQYPGYHCVCHRGYTGPNCEMVGATFTNNTYVLFPSINLVSSGHISLELLTTDSNGTILYAGSAVAHGITDYLMISLVQGHIQCELSLGGGVDPLIFSFSEFPVNDGSWITIDIRHDTNVINMSVTRYDSPYHRKQTAVNTTGKYYLDVSLPLVLGKIPYHLSALQPHPPHSVQGCMRNVIVNGDPKDFSKALLQEDIAGLGCTYTDGNCDNDTCSNAGECIGQWEGFECVCPASHKGDTCDEVSDSVYFNGELFIQYQILTDALVKRNVNQYSSGSTAVTLSFSTVTANGVLLQIGNNNISDHLIIKVVNGHIALSLDLGQGTLSSVISTVPVNDGEFHNATLTRRGKAVKLVLDNMYSVRGMAPGDDDLIDIPTDSVFLGSDSSLSSAFTGCMYGMRLDNKDLPTSVSNDYFVATPSEGGTIQTCNEPPETIESFDTFNSMYVLGGVVLGLLVIMVVLYLLLAKSTHYCYVKRRNKLTFSSRRDPIFSPVNPIAINRNSLRNALSYHGMDHGIFQQTRSSFELPTMEIKNDHSTNQISSSKDRQSTPSPINSNLPYSEATDHVPLIVVSDRPNPVPVVVPEPGLSVNTNPETAYDRLNPVPPEMPELASSINIKPKPTHSRPKPIPTMVPAPGSSISINPSQSTDKPKLKPKPTDSKTINQPTSKTELDPMTGMPLHVCHCDPDLESNHSVSTEGDVRGYIMNKIKSINERLSSRNYDELQVFSDEGPYDPLGSIGSLYDILEEVEREKEEEEEEEEVKIVKMEVHLKTGKKFDPNVPSSLLSSHSHSPTKQKPATKKPDFNFKQPQVLRKPISSSKKKAYSTEKLLMMRQLHDCTNDMARGNTHTQHGSHLESEFL